MLIARDFEKSALQWQEQVLTLTNAPRQCIRLSQAICVGQDLSATFLIWTRVNQIAKTLSFHIHLSQIRYQIKANTPAHMTRHAWLFFSVSFLKESSFFLVRRKSFERVYLLPSFQVSVLTITHAYGDYSCSIVLQGCVSGWAKQHNCSHLGSIVLTRTSLWVSVLNYHPWWLLSSIFLQGCISQQNSTIAITLSK